jgi:murein L,D-transpeptidase YcbB/YkuD
MTSAASIRRQSAEKTAVKKHSFRVVGFALVVVVLLTALVSESTGNGIRPTGTSSTSAARPALAPQQLTAEGKVELQSLMSAAVLAELRWPEFERYQSEVKEFYESFGGALPWMQNFTLASQARSMIQLLKSADSEGLNAEDYDGSRWDGRVADLERLTPPSESVLVRFDVALTVSSMRYVSDLSQGRANPRVVKSGLDTDGTTLDLAEFLRRELIDSSDLDAAVKALAPPFPTYHRTLDALRTYTQLARRDDGERLPVPRKPVRPGDSYAGLPRLTRLLALLGDLADKNSQQTARLIYQGALVDGVKRFQMRHGLEPNGRIDTATLRELNTPFSRRVTQLQLTLERLRWLPHRFERPPVIVNIPEFRLRAVDQQYHWVLLMKVVVGKAYRHRTPVFAANIKSVIFRPPWHVPLSIVRAEMVPNIEKDPAYLRKHSYEIVDRGGNAVSTDAVNAAIKSALYSGKLGIRQKPGPDNALGLIKFDLPNPYDVYMHGTPATELFARSRRDFSHGCIRVEDPVALATWLLRDKPGWTAERIRAATLGEETLRVDLGKPVPALIVYGTAVVMEDGEVRFFRDIYGHDAALERALASGQLAEPKNTAPGNTERAVL